jgi:DNA-binding NtrC family response regulator
VLRELVREASLQSPHIQPAGLREAGISQSADNEAIPALGPAPSEVQDEVHQENTEENLGTSLVQEFVSEAERRRYAVGLVRRDGLRVAEAARRVNRSRQWLYKWLRRFQADGDEGRGEQVTDSAA